MPEHRRIPGVVVHDNAGHHANDRPNPYSAYQGAAPGKAAVAYAHRGSGRPLTPELEDELIRAATARALKEI